MAPTARHAKRARVRPSESLPVLEHCWRFNNHDYGLMSEFTVRGRAAVPKGLPRDDCLMACTFQLRVGTCLSPKVLSQGDCLPDSMQHGVKVIVKAGFQVLFALPSCGPPLVLDQAPAPP